MTQRDPDPTAKPAGGPPKRSLADRVRDALGNADDPQADSHPVAQSLEIQLEALLLLRDKYASDPSQKKALEGIDEQLKNLSKLRAGFDKTAVEAEEVE